MKVVILAGGRGTRLGPLTDERPKPMLEVGGRPLLWHIMRSYAQFGFREFTIALGYRGQIIKDYFLNYRAETGDVTVTLATGQARFHAPVVEDWIVHLVDTGNEPQTGGRLKRLAPRLDTTFFMTYGDGLADVDIAALLRFHRQHGRLATVTAVRPPARFGHLSIDGTQAVGFNEKPQVAEGWINGGYFVLEPAALELIADDQTAWEIQPMQALARRGQLGVLRHEGFWQCVDTPRELAYLESLWQTGRAPWLPAPSRFQCDSARVVAPGAVTRVTPLTGVTA